MKKIIALLTVVTLLALGASEGFAAAKGRINKPVKSFAGLNIDFNAIAQVPGDFIAGIQKNLPAFGSGISGFFDSVLVFLKIKSPVPTPVLPPV